MKHSSERNVPDLRFETRAIRVGQEPDESTRSVVPPLIQTSTFVRNNRTEDIGYVYARGDNPTRQRWETCMASMENGSHGIAFGSGMAAISAVFSLVAPGEEVLVTSNIYGGTYRYIERIVKSYGIGIRYVPTWDAHQVADALTDRVSMVFIETPSNPLMEITNIRAMAELKSRRPFRLAVDNTFLTPYYQRPLELGADLVVHSATKYLGGHSDSISGAVVLNDDDTAEELRFFQNSQGAIPGPFDCWLLLRSAKTLGIRMEKHNSNGIRIATEIRDHPAVNRVFYPGLPGNPGYPVACEQQKTEEGQTGFGGMISVEFPDEDIADRFMNNLTLFSIAESLGGVESLVGHPFTMSHSGIPEKQRIKAGISPGLVRISVGIEHCDDLLDDIHHALETLIQ